MPNLKVGQAVRLSKTCRWGRRFRLPWTRPRSGAYKL
jgi:hypothetical protein